MTPVVDATIPPRCWRREVGMRALRFLELNDFRGAWRLGQIVSRLALRPPEGVICCSTNYGFVIVINPGADSGVESSIFMTGSYEHGTLEVIRAVLSEGDVFLDIGANVGLMSLFAAQLVGDSGQVHSFEPVPELYSMLSASVRANGLTNMFPHCFALGANDEDRNIFEHPEINRGSSSMVDPGDLAHGVPVSVKTVDGFVSTTLSGNRIALAKIDVEGWELEVLKGGLAVFRSSIGPALCVEYSTLHPTFGGAALDLFDFVISSGYVVFKLKSGKSTKSGLIRISSPDELPEHDNIFCFKDEQLGRLDKALFIDYPL